MLRSQCWQFVQIGRDRLNLPVNGSEKSLGMRWQIENQQLRRLLTLTAKAMRHIGRRVEEITCLRDQLTPIQRKSHDPPQNIVSLCPGMAVRWRPET